MRVRRSHFCSCGQIVRGNFAKRQHREVHRSTGDSHKYVSMDIFRQLFPGWRGGPQERIVKGAAR